MVLFQACAPSLGIREAILCGSLLGLVFSATSGGFVPKLGLAPSSLRGLDFLASTRRLGTLSVFCGGLLPILLLLALIAFARLIAAAACRLLNNSAAVGCEIFIDDPILPIKNPLLCIIKLIPGFYIPGFGRG